MPNPNGITLQLCCGNNMTKCVHHELMAPKRITVELPVESTNAQRSRTHRATISKLNPATVTQNHQALHCGIADVPSSANLSQHLSWFKQI